MKNQEERGMLTENVQKIAKQFLGEEITREELRLYPYIDYCLKNCGIIERIKMNDLEFQILEKRQNQGYLNRTGKYITVTRPFYDYIQNILAESYVLFEEVEK